VYAREGSAADSAARQVGDLGREFTHRTGARPTAGLVIVNDLADDQIGDLKPDELLNDEKQKKALIEQGIDVQEFMLSMAIPLEKSQFSRQTGFNQPAFKTVGWVASVPSQRRVDQFGQHLIDAGMKKMNLNFVQRLMLMPFMPLLHGLLNDAFDGQRDTMIYECFCNAQNGWSDERRKKEIAAYQEKRMGMVVNSLKAATQQATNAAQ